MRDARADRSLSLAIVLLGLSSIVTQTILLREFLTVFSGNELVIGIVLANWMILTGLGAYLGRFAEHLQNKTALVTRLFLFLSLLPPITAFLLSWLRGLLFPAGTMLGIIECFAGSLLLLLPYCLLSGALFTLFAAVVSARSGSNAVASVYTLESAGSLVGGLLFNVILVFFFSTFQALLLLAVVNLMMCCVLAIPFASKSFQLLIISLGAILLLLAARVDLDGVAKQYLFRNQDLVIHQDTPYGSLVVTRTGEQLNFYENSSLLFVTNDRAMNEDAVHYAMAQHPNPKRVLLIGGGISGTTNEILKHRVELLDYVEINPPLLELGYQQTSSLNDPRIRTFAEDARRFIRHCDGVYDVVVVNVPDPSTAQINRYYSVQFFRQLRAVLTPHGVVALGLLPSDDYAGPEARRISSVVYHTLESQFTHVLILPGIRNHFIASDRELTTAVAATITARKINTTYVNRYYVDDGLLAQRSASLMRSVTNESITNEDFTPVAYFRQLEFWLSYFGTPVWIPGILLGLVFTLVVWRSGPINLGMFTGGFVASGLEIVLVFCLQVMYGYVYRATGVIIAVFMAGLAAGSFVAQRSLRTPSLATFGRILAATGLCALLTPLVLRLLTVTDAGDGIVYAVFTVITLLIGGLVGFEFSVGTKLLKGTAPETASKLYSVDLIGAAVGAMAISIYLVPLLGIPHACTVLAVLCLACTIVVLVRGGIDSPSFLQANEYV